MRSQANIIKNDTPHPNLENLEQDVINKFVQDLIYRGLPIEQLANVVGTLAAGYLTPAESPEKDLPSHITENHMDTSPSLEKQQEALPVEVSPKEDMAEGKDIPNTATVTVRPEKKPISPLSSSPPEGQQMRSLDLRRGAGALFPAPDKSEVKKKRLESLPPLDPREDRGRIRRIASWSGSSSE